MRKRMLSLLLSLVLVLSAAGPLCAVPVSADEAPVVKNIIYMIPDGGGMAPFYLADELKAFGGFNSSIFPNATRITTSEMYIKEYLNDYKGVDGALFVSEKSHRRFRDDSSVETIVKKWGELAGVPNAKPHRFRHTFITRCIDKGISIEDTRQLVGHENIGTTEGYYDHNQSRVKAEHDRLCA